MYLVRIGHRTINLEYLIETADSALEVGPREIPEGKIRVSVYPGKVFDVDGDAAAHLRLHLSDNLKPLPSPPSPPEATTGAQSGNVIRRPPKSPKSDGASNITPRKE